MNKPYQVLAENYDLLFHTYRSWGGDARQELIGHLLPNVKSACDLACGTGTAALELAAEGRKVYGVDLSPTMCKLARAKARRRGMKLEVIEADMRTFRLPQPVDLIICEFDAINHIPRQSDLVRVARSAFGALNPGGHFYFDINMRGSFEKLWPLTWWIEKPGVVMVMHGGHKRGTCRAWADADFFIQRGKRWERHTERIEEICWTHAEIRAALKTAGFATVRHWDAARLFPGDPLMRPGIRSYYLAGKR